MQAREGREDVEFSGELAEELDGADAVGVEDVVNVRGEIVPDGGGRDRDAWGPVFDELFDIEEAVIARGPRGLLRVGRR